MILASAESGVRSARAESLSNPNDFHLSIYYMAGRSGSYTGRSVYSDVMNTELSCRSRDNAAHYKAGNCFDDPDIALCSQYRQIIL